MWRIIPIAVRWECAEILADQGGTADASPPSSAVWTAALSMRVDNVTAVVVTAMRDTKFERSS